MEEDERNKFDPGMIPPHDAADGDNNNNNDRTATPIATGGDVKVVDRIAANISSSNGGEPSPLHHRQLTTSVPITASDPHRQNNTASLYLDFDDDDDDDSNYNNIINTTFQGHGLGRPIHTGSHDVDVDVDVNVDRNNSSTDEDDQDDMYYDDLAPRSSWRYAINSCTRKCCRRLWACPKCCWLYVQSSRSKARQRRADILLERPSYVVDDEDTTITGRDWKRSMLLCLSSSCDDTDTGIAVLIASTVVWGLLLWWFMMESSSSSSSWSTSPTVRRGVVFGGAAFFIVRICSRPIWEHAQRLYYGGHRGRRSRHHRHHHQPLPQDSPSGKRNPINHRNSTRGNNVNDSMCSDDDYGGGDVTRSSSLELGALSSIAAAAPNGIRRFRTESPSEADEDGCDNSSNSDLPGIFMTASEESDPNIAAI